MVELGKATVALIGAVLLCHCATGEVLGTVDNTYEDADLGAPTDIVDIESGVENDSAVTSDPAIDSGSGDQATGSDRTSDTTTEQDSNVSPDESRDRMTDELAITTPVDTCLVVGEELSLAFHAAGAEGSLTWSAQDLPRGLELTPTGILTGSFDTAGDYAFTIRVEGGTKYGEREYVLSVEPQLLLALGAPGYLEGRADGTDVLSQAIVGETDETRCGLYYASGGGGFVAGVTPSDTDPTNCTLLGDAHNEAIPGVYGVLVEVTGGCDQKVYVPIRYVGNGCTTGPHVVEPAATDMVRQADTAYTRRFTINDIDACVDTGSSCDCSGCARIDVGARPLSVLPEYPCEGADVCLDRCDDDGSCSSVPDTGGCPSTFTYTREILTQPHDLAGPVGASAVWVSYDIDVLYSGENHVVEECGDKRFQCHIDVLEQ